MLLLPKLLFNWVCLESYQAGEGTLSASPRLEEKRLNNVSPRTREEALMRHLLPSLVFGHNV